MPKLNLPAYFQNFLNELSNVLFYFLDVYILIFNPECDFEDYIDPDCLPDKALLDKIDEPRLFLNSIALQK